MHRFRQGIAWGMLLCSFVATHWPALQLPPTFEGGDQVLHFVTFLAVGLAVWWADWFPTPSRFLLAALGWSLLDESLQGIEIIQRWTVDTDFLANASGVTVAWAFASANRSTPATRLAMERAVVSRRNAIPALASATLLGAMAGSTLAMAALPLLRWLHQLPAVQSAIIGAVLGVCVAFQAMWWSLAQAIGAARPPRNVRARAASTLNAAAMLVGVALACVGVARLGVALGGLQPGPWEPDAILVVAIPFLVVPILAWIRPAGVPSTHE